jgi:hypothetical protein
MARSGAEGLIDEVGRAKDELHRLEVRELASRVYALLPHTINVSFRGLVVPVPIKVIITESLFLECAEIALHLVDGGLQALEDRIAYLWRLAEQRGVSTESMLAMATRRAP